MPGERGIDGDPDAPLDDPLLFTPDPGGSGWVPRGPSGAANAMKGAVESVTWGALGYLTSAWGAGLATAGGMGITAVAGGAAVSSGGMGVVLAGGLAAATTQTLVGMNIMGAAMNTGLNAVAWGRDRIMDMIPRPHGRSSEDDSTTTNDTPGKGVHALAERWTLLADASDQVGLVAMGRLRKLMRRGAESNAELELLVTAVNGLTASGTLCRALAARAVGTLSKRQTVAILERNNPSINLAMRSSLDLLLQSSVVSLSPPPQPPSACAVATILQRWSSDVGLESDTADRLIALFLDEHRFVRDLHAHRAAPALAESIGTLAAFDASAMQRAWLQLPVRPTRRP